MKAFVKVQANHEGGLQYYFYGCTLSCNACLLNRKGLHGFQTRDADAGTWRAVTTMYSTYIYRKSMLHTKLRHLPELRMTILPLSWQVNSSGFRSQLSWHTVLTVNTDMIRPTEE